MSAATTRIIIVSGQEFTVPAETNIEDVRKHLAATFPDVATATIQKGTKTIDGVAYETVEFVKKAGTKGAGMVAEILAALDVVPPAPRARRLSTRAAALVAEARTGNMTIGQALNADLLAVLDTVTPTATKTDGGSLCATIDRISPAARDVGAW